MRSGFGGRRGLVLVVAVAVVLAGSAVVTGAFSADQPSGEEVLERTGDRYESAETLSSTAVVTVENDTDSVSVTVEMAVALGSMVPAAWAAERVGLKPVVGAGFAVYALFPLLLIFAPDDPVVLAGLFAFSGMRFAGLPSHKALIVGPAEADAGGRVTGAYYLLRNVIVIPSGALGGLLWEFGSPELAFGVATAIGLVGTGYFLLFGEEFAAYA